MGSFTNAGATLAVRKLIGEAVTPPPGLFLALMSMFSVRNASYQWTASANGGYFYLEDSGGGAPTNVAADPDHVVINDAEATRGTAVDDLNFDEWQWGDAAADSLGFDTIYTRPTGGTDPDTQPVDYILAGANPLKDLSQVNEVTGNGYARVAIPFGANVPGSRQVVQNAQVDYAALTGDVNWVSHWIIFDLVTGGQDNSFGALLAPVKLLNGNEPKVAAGECVISINADFVSNYAADNVLDWMYNSAAFTVASNFSFYADTDVTDSDTGTTISEPTDAAYARLEINEPGGGGVEWNAVVAGLTDNASELLFAAATEAQGTITAAGVCDALTLGQVIFKYNGITDQPVGIDDRIRIPAGDLNAGIL